MKETGEVTTLSLGGGFQLRAAIQAARHHVLQGDDHSPGYPGAFRLAAAGAPVYRHIAGLGGADAE